MHSNLFTKIWNVFTGSFYILKVETMLHFRSVWNLDLWHCTCRIPVLQSGTPQPILLHVYFRRLYGTFYQRKAMHRHFASIRQQKCYTIVYITYGAPCFSLNQPFSRRCFASRLPIVYSNVFLSYILVKTRSLLTAHSPDLLSTLLDFRGYLSLPVITLTGWRYFNPMFPQLTWIRALTNQGTNSMLLQWHANKQTKSQLQHCKPTVSTTQITIA